MTQTKMHDCRQLVVHNRRPGGAQGHPAAAGGWLGFPVAVPFAPVRKGAPDTNGRALTCLVASIDAMEPRATMGTDTDRRSR
jgi:hypothetical protein